MTTDRELPGWAEPVEGADDRIVTCPSCGQVMTWAKYLEHGRDCDGREED